MKHTSLSELGEFKLIEELTKRIQLRNSSSIKGVGDDAAVIDCNGKYVLLSTDVLIENIHFDFMYSPVKHLGYKAVVVNLSDIYAMNGTPGQISVSFAASNKISYEVLRELYSGIELACDKYKVDLVGGDTCSSKQGFFISVSVIGECGYEEIAYRSGAGPNELICVSGDLGAAYIGLQLLEREKFIYQSNPNVQPQLAGYDYILERQLKPEARADILQILKDLKLKPTSMIDISDGLSSELLHISKQSDTGCKIFEDKLPIAPETKEAANELEISPTTCAMNGGEDYELLFTLPLEAFDKIKDIPRISVIGHTLQKDEGNFLISRDARHVPLRAQGWVAWTEEERKQ
jgi:thiamine-monophosphate kinase